MFKILLCIVWRSSSWKNKPELKILWYRVYLLLSKSHSFKHCSSASLALLQEFKFCSLMALLIVPALVQEPPFSLMHCSTIVQALLLCKNLLFRWYIALLQALFWCKNVLFRWCMLYYKPRSCACARTYNFIDSIIGSDWLIYFE